MLSGVYKGVKKDGTVYYRSSVTYKSKHISLGSFATEKEAHRAYKEAKKICSTPSIGIDDKKYKTLDFKKYVILINYRDNDMYIKTPIYLKEKYFYYYFGPEDYLIFDSDDIFYYSDHSIMRRGGHLFVADFGMQVNILSRYGIKNFAVKSRDYRFINGDETDYRRANLEIINRYHGVTRKDNKSGSGYVYEARIHVNGDFVVGRYDSEIRAAIAYNKAADVLKSKGLKKDFPENYIEEYDLNEYLEVYNSVKISKKIDAFGKD
ncbi:MAG: hypothetical protein K5639_05255 [Eubacterium sp.]|nr:hypothetical protein [Eubacterium sp.]